MKLKKPISDYCATVVKLNEFTAFENCDAIVGALVLNNQVMVSKDSLSGEIGLYFPVETSLSSEFLKNNNLYRNKSGKENLNIDPEKSGFFEEHGRVRCVSFRGHKSEGFFIPLNSLDFIGQGFAPQNDLSVGDEFDEILGVKICEKYIPKFSKLPGVGGGGVKGKKPKVSKIVDGQFAFHKDTGMLYKNLHRIKLESLISITYKEHGSSGISSRILCNNKLSIWQKVVKAIIPGFNITEVQYDFINSSRKLIKNDDLNANPGGYYKEDIWGEADKVLRPYLSDGMTMYYEIVGYLSSGAMIQKGFSYGYEPPVSGENAVCGVNYGIKIYRITITTPDNKVHEYSSQMVQNFCKEKGLVPVHQLFFGYAKELSDERLTDENWQNKFLETIKAKYNEKDCFMCGTKGIPEEGCVIRLEDSTDFQALKCKSVRFLEKETKALDKGDVDIETTQS